MDDEDIAAMREDQKLETKEGFGPEGSRTKSRGADDRSVQAVRPARPRPHPRLTLDLIRTYQQPS